MHKIVPIAVFAFNRPTHLRQTLNALAANELASESDVTIYCDGPRNLEEQRLTAATRAVARKATGFRTCQLVERERNLGLAENIIRGVSESLEKSDSLIVLEDDLVTSPFFLRYMNDGLNAYADDSRVASIHGWCFPHAVPNPPETFFLRGADCWGWGTWKRAWRYFEPDAALLLRQLRDFSLEDDFNCNGAYDYMAMLKAVRDKKTNSWAVRWRASAFLHDLCTLYPGHSLVQNKGMDGSGTNCGVTKKTDVSLTSASIRVIQQPVQENAAMRQAERAFLASLGQSATLRSRLPFLPNRARCKKLCKDFLPPVVWRAAKRLIRGKAGDVTPGILWRGDYPDWQSAVAASTGYDQDAIFTRVRDAARAVRDGDALWERNSVLFHQAEYNWPLLAALTSLIAGKEGRRAFRVLDFGGAFGSTYWQHKSMLESVGSLSWNVVEQPHIVTCGQAEFTTDILHFWPDMETCTAGEPVDCILFSSVLQYVENPYDLLEQAVALRPRAIILDRTPFADTGERITVQHVPPEIYDASYPCRWLDKRRVLDLLTTDFMVSPWWQSQVDPSGFLGVLALARQNGGQTLFS